MRTYYEKRLALGTNVQMALVTGGGQAAAASLLNRLWLEVFSFERRCSRFLPDSELSRFNRAAGVKMDVTPEFRAVLAAAKRVGEWTGGLFNPFILPGLQRAGYVRSLVPGHADDAADDHSRKAIAAVASLEVGDHWARIPYGSALDLGGCGKGYIGDCLARIASQEDNLNGFWFSVGGDTVTDGTDQAGAPWLVYLQPDPKSSDRLGEVSMPDDGRYAIATSTTALRRGVRAGKAWHHIIDPRTGRPAETDVTLATVCGQSLLEADVLASCLIVEGSAGAPRLARRLGTRDVLWQTDDGRLHATGDRIRLYDSSADSP